MPPTSTTPSPSAPSHVSFLASLSVALFPFTLPPSEEQFDLSLATLVPANPGSSGFHHLSLKAYQDMFLNKDNLLPKKNHGASH